MDVHLNFINKSNDANNSQIVIFQKNAAAPDAPVVPWHVIYGCGPGGSHTFILPGALTVGATMGFGRQLSQLSAQPGQAFAVTPTAAGDEIGYCGPAGNADEIAVLNELTLGAIDACIYRGGKLLATKTGVAPGQKAAFQFEPTIWIGPAAQAMEGRPMAITADIAREISLFGVGKADIVMTGGGPGRSSTPFQFSLDNVVMA